jgi:uncharacterized protein (TIGR03437 family)
VQGKLAVRNPGSGPLTIQSMTSNSARFEILGPGTPLLVAAGETRDVIVRFTPDAMGAQTGTITIASDAANQAQLAVTVRGTGADRQAARIALGPESVFFGRVEQATTKRGAVEIRNPNLPDLNVTWQASGAAFQVSGQPAAFTLKSGESRILDVAFSPPAAGSYSGTLTVRSNDTRRPDVAVRLGGFAIEPAPPANAPVFTAASLKSAASYVSGRLAEQMWVALEGQNLADEFIVPTDGYPTSLGGTRVLVTDSAGIERAAQLHFVSPDRLNFLMPAGTAPGVARVTVVNGQGEQASATAQIERVAPGLFSARSDGQGPAAATYLRVAANGTRTEDYTFTLDAARNNVPIPLGPEGEQVYLSLYGTGFRAHSTASARIGGLEVPLLGAVAHPQFAGLDQAVIGPLPRALAGRGEVTIELTFDGVKTNPVTVAVP